MDPSKSELENSCHVCQRDKKAEPFLTLGAFALDNGTLAHTWCKKGST